MNIYPGQAIPFGPMILSADHLSGDPAAVPVVSIRWYGGVWVPPQGAVSNTGKGFFEIAGNIADTGVIGPFNVHAEAPGADPFDQWFEIVTKPPAPDLNTSLLQQILTVLQATFNRKY